MVTITYYPCVPIFRASLFKFYRGKFGTLF